MPVLFKYIFQIRIGPVVLGDEHDSTTRVFCFVLKKALSLHIVRSP